MPATKMCRVRPIPLPDSVSSCRRQNKTYLGTVHEISAPI
jgi:hypothetical protein